jgi:hypothetical protein
MPPPGAEFEESCGRMAAAHGIGRALSAAFVPDFHRFTERAWRIGADRFLQRFGLPPHGLREGLRQGLRLQPPLQRRQSLQPQLGDGCRGFSVVGNDTKCD